MHQTVPLMQNRGSHEQQGLWCDVTAVGVQNLSKDEMVLK